MASRTSSNNLLTEVRERLLFAYTHDRDNRIEAAEDLKFLAGDQWPANVRAERIAASRPTLTIDKLTGAVNQVVNDFKQNPPAIKVTPVDDEGEDGADDLYNGILSEIQYRSNAIQVYGKAVEHAVSCGIGHFRIETGYVADDPTSFDQEITIRRIGQPLSVYWDPDSVEPTRSDANWCIVSEMITEKRFKEVYPGKSVASVDVPSSDFYGTSTLFWRQNDSIRIAEYWKKTPVKRKIALLNNGETIDITDLDHNILQHLPAQVVRERTSEDFKVQQWLVSNADVLDGANDWAGKYIPIIPIIGWEVPLEDKVIRGGLIRKARDPQMLYNYNQSAAAEMVALAPRAPFLATPDMIKDFKGQWDTMNTVSRPYMLYKPDPSAPGAKPQREPPPAVPAAFMETMRINSDDIKATTGIYDASLGRRSNETSGVAIRARDHQGDVGSFQFVDNAHASLTHAGRIIVDLIPKIYDSERTVKLYSEEHEEPKFATINQAQMMANGEAMVKNDLSKGKFECRVKLGPSYETRRAEGVDSMMRFIQAFPQAAQVAGDLVANAMDWKNSEKIAQRLQRMIPPNILGDDAPPPTPQQQQQQAQQQAQQQKAEQFHDAMAQTELAHKQAQVGKTQAETQLKGADAMLRQFEAMIARMHALMQQHGMNVNQPSNGYPNPDGYASPSQGPSEHQQVHGDYQSTLDSMSAEQKLRKDAALASQAEARTQGAILDNQFKRQKLGQDRYPLTS